MNNSQKKQKESSGLNYLIGILACLLVISGIIMYGMISELTKCKNIPEVEEESIILLEFLDWSENALDSSEVFFTYYVYNFGNVEAKGIVINCNVTDINDNLIKSETYEIGNIASNSVEYKESFMKFHLEPSEYLAICYFQTAEGEYIDLSERLNI